MAMKFGFGTFLSAAAVLVAVSAQSAGAETFTLEQALGMAYETNPRLDAERAALRATDEDVAKALSGFRPSIGVSGSYGYTKNDIGNVPLAIPNGHPRDVTVTIDQPLFTGSTIPQTRQAKSAVSAGRAQLISVEQSVLLAAAKSYFDVVGDETALKYRQENVALLDDQRRMTEERVAIGDVTRTDLQLVEARLSAANADVAFAQARLAASRAEFLREVGRPAETLEETPKLPQMPGAAEQALSRAIENNPDLATVREQARTADAAVAVAEGALLPSLSLQGQYRKSRDEIATGIDSSAISVIAQIRVPLYQRGEEYAGIRKAKEIRSRATLAITDIDRQVRRAVESAWRAQLAAREAVAFREQQVLAAEAAYEGYAQAFRTGETTTFDLLNSAQEILSARVALADTRRQYYISSFELILATGDLTARSLNLPVKLYDPQTHYDRNAGRWIGFGD